MFYFKIISGTEISYGYLSFLPENAVEITKDEYDQLVKEDEIHRERLRYYLTKVVNGEITLDEVPEEYRQEVADIISTLPSNEYGVSDDLYNQIIDDYTMSLIDGGLI